MEKTLIKPVFGVPSAEVIGRIYSSDKVAALHMAGYRYEARVSELEVQFEVGVAKLRENYLDEVLKIPGDDEE